MKRFPWWLPVVALAAVHVLLFVRDFGPAGSMHGPGGGLMTGVDLSLRRNEAACVLKGVNPYDVWTKKAVVEPYYPFGEKPSPGFSEPVNAYTPWEYVAAFPYALLEKQTAWHVHLAVMWLSLIALVLVLARIGGLPAAAAALLYVIPVNVDFNCGNYPIVITAATACMLMALDRGDRMVPALMWSLAMFKPQMSVLLALPLLLCRQWTVGIVSAAICLCLSFIPAALCHASVIDLVLQAPAASAHGFSGCALMPGPILDVLKQLLPAGVWMGVAMLLGAFLCALLTWRLRDSRSWFVLSAPCLVCSVSWTYVLQYSYVLTTVFAAVVVADIARNRTVGRILLGVPAILLWARFARGVEIVAERLMPSLSPVAGFACQMSATAALVLSVIYLWTYSDTLKRLSFKWMTGVTK